MTPNAFGQDLIRWGNISKKDLYGLNQVSRNLAAAQEMEETIELQKKAEAADKAWDALE